MADAVDTIIAFIVCIILGAAMLLPKKIKYGVFAVFLIILGAVPLFFKLGVLGTTFTDYPILLYITTFTVILAGRALLEEGIHMESHIKWVLIGFGSLAVILTTIPSLYAADAISFGLPKFMVIVNYFLYIICAGLLVVGIFMSSSD